MNPPGNTTIICYNVPPPLLHKKEAKLYFQSFGNIVKIIVKPKSHKCIVEYETAEAAEEALCLGGEFEGVEFPIEFQLKKPAKEVKEKRHVMRKDPDPDWALDEDVKAELEAMGTTPKKQYNLRPEKMVVDVELKQLVKKATRAERAEAKKRAATADPSVGGLKKSLIAQERELLNVIRQQACSTEDKYKILDARDKLIRLGIKKEDVQQLGATVGTCPDMCPEKERLMREVQHQVALYEQSNDRSMNHRIAVKQYSRSSADQEAPLPHELRNVDVLQMTMGYLMRRIMPLVDDDNENDTVNLGEWFHFLWDRMRGIRKEITQQELCCQGSVELVEQCARYHVHCSARLVAEDPSVFDQKINTENLTKCLQTLKYMYQDLAIKGERCPNEAEFRAYVILLNLNDGNFMWEVQQLSLDVQKSAEVKFALEVYSSLDTNNFVRFFKLVRRTTYLNACILLRYFMQVRTKAMRMISKCYTSRTSYAQLPVAQMTEMLAFENETACEDFVISCGLNVEGTEQRAILLSKQDFIEPDGSYALERAINVIESKRLLQLGEVVCGGTLPPPVFETHEPENSFTEDGYFINSSDFGTDVTDRREKDVKEGFSRNVFNREREDSNSRDIFEVPASKTFSVEKKLVKPTHTPLIGGFTFDLPIIPVETRIENEQREQLNALDLEKKRLENELRLEEQREEERRIMEVAIRKAEERRLQAEREREQHEVQQRLAFQKQEQERLQLEMEQRLKLQNEQHRLQKELQRKQQEERRIIEIKQAEQDRIVEEERRKAKYEAVQLQKIQSAVSTLLTELVTTVEQTIIEDDVSKLREKALARFAIKKWRNKITANIRKRKAVDLGPQWINKMTNEEVARQLHTSQQELTLNLMKRYKRGVAEESPERKSCFNITKLDLKSLTGNNLLSNGLKRRCLQNELFWKIGIYFECSNLVRKVMNMAVGWDHTEILLERFKVGQNTLTYCLHRSKMEESEDMNGLIIVVRQLSEDLLDKLLGYLNTLGDLVRFPVYFILENEDPTLRLEIETLLQNKLISEEATLICNFVPENLNLALGRGLKFLSTQYQPQPLVLNTLRSFLGENLGGEFFQKVRACSRWNLQYKRCVAKPDIAIGLFNQALEKLEAVMFDNQRIEYPDFPEIFKAHLQNQIADYLPCDYKYFPKFWKSDLYRTKLQDAFKQFYLPEYNGIWPLEVNREMETELRGYCKLLSNKPLEIEKLFLRIFAKLAKTSDSGTHTWLDVVEIILEFNLKRLDLSLPDDLKTKTSFNQLIVVYLPEQLEAHNNDPWYYMKNSLVQDAVSMNGAGGDEFIDADEKIVSDVEIEDIPLEIEMHMKRVFAPDPQEDERQANVKKCKAAMDDFRMLMDDLEESMKIQRLVSKKFQTNLMNFLDNK